MLALSAPTLMTGHEFGVPKHDSSGNRVRQKVNKYINNTELM